MRRVFLVIDILALMAMIAALVGLLFFDFQPSTTLIAIAFVFAILYLVKESISDYRWRAEYYYFVSYSYTTPKHNGHGSVTLTSNTRRITDRWITDLKEKLEDHLSERDKMDLPNVVILNVQRIDK